MSKPYIVMAKLEATYLSSNDTNIPHNPVVSIKPTWGEEDRYGTHKGKYEELTSEEQSALRALLRRIIERLETEESS